MEQQLVAAQQEQSDMIRKLSEMQDLMSKFSQFVVPGEAAKNECDQSGG